MSPRVRPTIFPVLPVQFMPLGFNFHNCLTCERRMIKVLLERAGYTDVQFYDGLLPFSRVVEAMRGPSVVWYTYQ